MDRAKDGRGLDKMKAAVESLLLALSSKVECVLPYSEAALLAAVHKTGTIISEEYADDGTALVAFVPASLRNRMGKACERAGNAFEQEAPEVGGRVRAEGGSKRMKPRAKRR